MSWKNFKIKDFAEVITGGTPSTTVKEYWENGDIPWLNSGELNEDIVVKSDNFITKLGLEKSAARLMPQDSVLIALTGATTGVVGYLTIEACANQSVTGILPSNKHYSKYLYYYLKSIREKVLCDSYGGAQKHISQGYVKDLEIPLPPFPIQKRIAEILDAADALRRKDEKLLRKYDELAQAIFIDMFGDPVKNEKGWEVKEFGAYIDYMGDIGSNGSNEVVAKNLNMLDREDFAIMIRTTNLAKNDFTSNVKYVSEKTYNFFKKSKIYGGEIIMNKIGSAGDFWIMPKLNKPVSLGLNQLVIRLKDLNTKFIYYYLSTDYGKSIIKSSLNGAVTKSITKSAVKALPILYPEIKLQEKFELLLSNIETEKEKLNNSVLNSNLLFDSLLQQAFKGELVK
jgi:type I restriction enzyme S subunit